MIKLSRKQLLINMLDWINRNLNSNTVHLVQAVYIDLNNNRISQDRAQEEFYRYASMK